MPIYTIIAANQAELPISTMCTTLGVSTSGYYDWFERDPSKRSVANDALSVQIKAAHTLSDQTYGRARIQAELAANGVVANHKRIARLMRTAGIQGVSRRRSYCVTTERNLRQRPAPDLVNRQFSATDINQLWVADMTYIPTWAGFVYLAVVIDVFSRKVVGWAFGVHMSADLVIDALNMGLAARKPKSVIHHSDQGSQYTSVAFGNRCQTMGVRPSMGTVGDAYDNAMAESFFASLECELIDRRSWRTKTEARLAVFTWIESWYNPVRRHSGIGYQSPINFEKELQNQKKQTPTQIEPLNQPSELGLPTGCFALVDNASRVPGGGTPSCPQASPMDNPTPQLASSYTDGSTNVEPEELLESC
jgi:putative transposase